MLEKIKAIYRRLKKAGPGNRFQKYHQKEKGGGPDWKQNAYIILGSLLIVVGILLPIPPGIRGFVVVIGGCAIIAARSRLLARSFDKFEVELRKIAHKLR